MHNFPLSIWWQQEAITPYRSFTDEAVLQPWPPLWPKNNVMADFLSSASLENTTYLEQSRLLLLKYFISWFSKLGDASKYFSALAETWYPLHKIFCICPIKHLLTTMQEAFEKQEIFLTEVLSLFIFSLQSHIVLQDYRSFKKIQKVYFGHSFSQLTRTSIQLFSEKNPQRPLWNSSNSSAKKFRVVR